MKLLQALLSLVAAFWVGPALAQSTSAAPVAPGYMSLSGCPSSALTPCFVPYGPSSGPGGSVTQGTSPWVTSDNGTKITAATMPAGGVGVTGWLSAIFNALGSPFQAGGSIGNTSFGVSSLPGSPMQQTGGSVGLVAGSNVIGGVGAPYHLVSSTLTTPTGVTYTAATSANPLAICANASVTICAPLTITISSTQTNSGYVTRLVLQKSTTGATAASFRLNIFETAPTMTAIYDTTAYVIPAADVLSKAWLGGWSCTTTNANLESFECSPDASSGYNAFNTTNGTLYGIVTATGAYVRATGETFNIVADISATVP